MDSGQNNHVLLEKFRLNPDELDKAKELIEKHVVKIKRNGEFEELKLEMKIHGDIQNASYEIRGKLLFPRGIAVSEDRNENPFIAIDSVLKKINTEFEHKIKK